MRAASICLAVLFALHVAPLPLAEGVSATGQLAPPVIAGRAAFILDNTTGRGLYSYYADTLRYPASTTKMMTAIVAFRLLRLDQVLTVPAQAMVGGTSAYLSPGEQMTVRNLFYGMLLPSGNDAAATFAVAISGSTLAFSRLMNAQARRFHLWHTHFLGATGLDAAGQYTTARDLAWLAHDLLRYKFLARIVRTKTYSARSVDGRYSHVWTNLDKLLWWYPGAIGVKTGTTPGAGANLVAAATRRGHTLIAGLLGSTVADRFSDGAAVLNYGWRLEDLG